MGPCSIFDFGFQIYDLLFNRKSPIVNRKSGGPEGIRTPDLLSAIEARSQLRYRPMIKAFGILIEGQMNVKQRISYDSL